MVRLRPKWAVALKAVRLRPVRVWLRHRGLRSEDVFLVSYPRSGNTWMRFLLYQILAGRSAEFAALRHEIPYVGKHHKAPSLLPGGGRLIKSHEPYAGVYRGSTVIYVVRDTRDVALSEYRFRKQRNLYVGEFDSFLSLFLAGRVHGLGSWAEHVEGWSESGPARRGRMLLIKYEDLRRNPAGTLAGIASFLGVPAEPEAIRRAVEHNELKNMRAKEDRVDRSEMFKRANPAFSHVNQGLVEGWRGKLSPDQLQLLEQKMGNTLARLGYTLTQVTRRANGTSRA